jgi:Amt family ammonium transporter
VGAYAAGATFVLLKVIDRVVGLRVPVPDEKEGLDSTEHGEQGYAF